MEQRFSSTDKFRPRDVTISETLLQQLRRSVPKSPDAPCVVGVLYTYDGSCATRMGSPHSCTNYDVLDRAAKLLALDHNIVNTLIEPVLGIWMTQNRVDLVLQDVHIETFDEYTKKAPTRNEYIILVMGPAPNYTVNVWSTHPNTKPVQWLNTTPKLGDLL